MTREEMYEIYDTCRSTPIKDHKGCNDCPLTRPVLTVHSPCEHLDDEVLDMCLMVYRLEEAREKRL